MRQTLECPKCKCRKLICVDPYRTPFRGGVGNPGKEMCVVYEQKTGEGWKSDWNDVGRIAAWICSSCGYTELWSHSFQELRPDQARGVHFVDGDNPPQGVYR